MCVCLSLSIDLEEEDGSDLPPSANDAYRQQLLKYDQQLEQNKISTAVATSDKDALLVKKSRLEAMDDAEFEAKVAEKREAIITAQTELFGRCVGNVFLAHSFLTTGAPRVAGSTSVQALIKALVVAKVYRWNQGYDLLSQEVQSAAEIPALLTVQDDPDGTLAKAFEEGLAKVESKFLANDIQSSAARTVSKTTASNSDSEPISYRQLEKAVEAVMSVYRADLLESEPERSGQIDCQLLDDAKDAEQNEDVDAYLVLYEFRNNVVVLSDIASKIDGSEGEDAAIEAAHLMAIELGGEDESVGLAMLAMETNVLGGRDFHKISVEEMTKFVKDAAVALHDGVTMAEMRAYITPKDEDAVSAQHRCLLLLFDRMSDVTGLYVKENYDASDSRVVNAMLVEINAVRSALIRGISSLVEGEVVRRSRNLSGAGAAASAMVSSIDSLIQIEEGKLKAKQNEVEEIEVTIAKREEDAIGVENSAKAEIASVDGELGTLSTEIAQTQQKVEECRKATEEANDKLSELTEEVDNAQENLDQLLEQEKALEEQRQEALNDRNDARDADTDAAAAETAAQNALVAINAQKEEMGVRLENQQDWTKFVKAIYNAFTKDPQVMAQRKTIRDTLEAKMDEFMSSDAIQGFDWVFDILESCQGLFKEDSEELSPEELERWRELEKNDEFYSIDLFALCDNVLGTKVSLAFDDRSNFVASVAGAGMSWKEAKEDLEKEILQRLYFAGLEFDGEGKLQVYFPWFDFTWADVRKCSEALYKMIERRFKTFFKYRNEKSHVSPDWEELDPEMEGEAIANCLKSLNAWNDSPDDYAIRMKDVMRCFARKLKVIAQYDVVFDNNVKIPGIDLGACSGYSTMYFNPSSKDSFTIDTTGNKLTKFKSERARHGDDYESGSQRGSDGDIGANGLAGMHGGHVLFQAAKKFEGIEKVGAILANGADGLKGQKGGHGGKGMDGAGGKPATPTEIQKFTSAEFRIASAHFPGLSGDDCEPDPSKENQMGGRGGNGGQYGPSGPSGHGGNVTFATNDGIVYSKACAGYEEPTSNKAELEFDQADYLEEIVENAEQEPILDTAADNDADGGDAGGPGWAGEQLQVRKEGFMWGMKNGQHGKRLHGYFKEFSDAGVASGWDIASTFLLCMPVVSCTLLGYRRVVTTGYVDNGKEAYRDQTMVNGRCPKDWIPRETDQTELTKRHTHQNSKGSEGQTAAEIAAEMKENGDPAPTPEEVEQRGEQNVNEEISEMQEEAIAIGIEKDSVLNEMLDGYAAKEEELQNKFNDLAAQEAQKQQELDQATIHHQETTQNLKAKDDALNDVESQLDATRSAISAAEAQLNNAISASLDALQAAMDALDLQQDAELELAMEKVEEGNLEMQKTIVNSLEQSTKLALQSSADELQREQETVQKMIESIEQTIAQLEQQRQSAQVVSTASKGGGDAEEGLLLALDSLNNTISQNKNAEATMEMQAMADTSNLVDSMVASESGQTSKADRRKFFSKAEMAIAASETVGETFCLHHVQQAYGDGVSSIQDVEQTMAKLRALVDFASQSEVNSAVDTAFTLQTLEVIVRFGFVDKKIFDVLNVPNDSYDLTSLRELLRNFNEQWFKVISDDIGFRNMMRDVNTYEGHAGGLFGLERIGLHVKYAHYPGEFELSDLDQQILSVRDLLLDDAGDVFGPMQALITSYADELGKVHQQAQSPDNLEAGLIALLLGRVSAFKSGVVQLLETWATVEGSKSLLVHELEVNGILTSIAELQDLATSAEVDALNTRIQHLQVKIYEANEQENIFLYKPCRGTNFETLKTAFDIFLNASAPEDIVTALNDMTNILNEIDEAASDPRWPGELFKSANWQHVQAHSTSPEVTRAFAAFSAAGTDQYIRSLPYDDALLQVVREALRYREDIKTVDFPGVLRRKTAFFDVLKASSMPDMLLSNVLKIMQFSYPLPPSPEVLNQSRDLLFQLYGQLYPDEVKNADPPVLYEVLYEVTSFTLAERTYEDKNGATDEAANSARSASHDCVETLRAKLSGENGLLSLALTFEVQYYMEYTQAIALKMDDINAIATLIQEALAFKNDVQTIAYDDEEFLKLLADAICPEERTRDTLKKMWDDSLAATGEGSAFISQAVMEAALTRPPTDWDFLLEVESLNQMPAACCDILELHIATACLNAGEHVASATANRSLGDNYTKYVVTTAQTFMERVVAAEVLSQRHFQKDANDNSWTENANKVFKNAVSTVNHVEEETANAKDQFKEVEQRMVTDCRHECNLKVADRLDARLTAIYMNHVQYAEIKVDLVPVPDEDWKSLPQGAHLGIEYDPRTFLEGAQIEAETQDEGKDKWCPGVIAQVNGDGTYAIQYDSGKSESAVFGACIRVTAPDFAFGTKIEGNWRNGAAVEAWSPGLIAGVNADGTYYIKYDDDTTTRDAAKEHIRVAAPTFPLGTKIEANYRDGAEVETWYSGAIAGVNAGGTYNINYDDRTSAGDVSTSCIRIRTPAFALASKIEFQSKGNTAYIPGVIVGLNAGGTFDISYSNDNIELNVVAEKIRSADGESGVPVVPTVFALGSYIEAKKDTILDVATTSWYSGSVAGVNVDGTYYITYDDGNSARGVLEANIRATTPAFGLGSLVEGKWKGKDKWYPGAVVGVNGDGTFAIKYTNDNFESNVAVQYIKAATPTFALGSKVEARFGGQEPWAPGVITGVNEDGSYGIKYDDAGKSEPNALVENVRAPLPPEDVSEFWSQVAENTLSIRVSPDKISHALTWLPESSTPPTTNSLEVWMCLINVFMIPLSDITAEHYSTHASLCNKYVKLKKDKWEDKTEGRTETTTPSGMTITAREEREDLLDRLTNLGESMGLELLSRISDRKSTTIHTTFETYEAQITAIVEELELNDKKIDRPLRHVRQQNFLEYTMRKLNDYWFSGLIESASLEAVLGNAKQKLDNAGDIEFEAQVDILEDYLVAEVNKLGSYNLMAMTASLDTTDVREDMKHIVFKLATSKDAQSGLQEFVIGDGNDTEKTLFNCAKDMLILPPSLWEKTGGKYNGSAYLAAARVFDKLAEACGIGFEDDFDACTTALVWYWNLEEFMALYPDGTMWARSCTTGGTWSRKEQTISINWVGKDPITVQVSASGRHLLGKEENGSGATFVQAIAVPCADVLLLKEGTQIRNMRKTIDAVLNGFQSDELSDLVPAYAVTLAESVSKVVEALLKGCYRELDWRHGTLILNERTSALDTAMGAMTSSFSLTERRFLSLQTLDVVVLPDAPQDSNEECHAPKFVEESGEFKSVNDPWPLREFDPSTVLESDDPSDEAAVAIVFAWSEKLQLSFLDIYKNLVQIFPVGGPPPDESILSMVIDLLARNTQAWTTEHKVRDLILHHDDKMKSHILSLQFALQQCSGLPELGFNPTDTTAAWRAVLASEDHCKAIDMAFAGDCTQLTNSLASENLRLYMNDALAIVGSFEDPKAIWDLDLDVAGVERFSEHMRFYGDIELVQRVLQAKNADQEDHLAETQRKVLAFAESWIEGQPINEIAFAHLDLYLALATWIVSARSQAVSGVAEGSALVGVNASSDVLWRLVARAQVSVSAVKESPDVLLKDGADSPIKIDLFSLLRLLLNVSPEVMLDGNLMLNNFLETQKTNSTNALCLNALLSKVETSFPESANGEMDVEQLLKTSTGYLETIDWEHALSEAFFLQVSNALIDAPRLRSLQADMLPLLSPPRQGFAEEHVVEAVKHFDAVFTTNVLAELSMHYNGALYKVQLAHAEAIGVPEAQQLCDFATEDVSLARSVHEAIVALASVARGENQMPQYAAILGQFMRHSIALEDASHVIYLMRGEGISAVHTAVKSIKGKKGESISNTTFVWDLYEYFVRASFEEISSAYDDQEPVGLLEAIDELMAAAGSHEAGVMFGKILYTSLQRYRSLQSNQLGSVIVRNIVDLCVQTSVYGKCAGPNGFIPRKLINTVFPSWRVLLRKMLVHQRLGSKADQTVEENMRVYENRNGVIFCNLVVGMLSNLDITVGNTRVLTERLANGRWHFEREDSKATKNIEDEDHWMFVCKLYEGRRKEREGQRSIPRLLQLMEDDPVNTSISYFLQPESDEYDLTKLIERTKRYFNEEGEFDVEGSKPAAKNLTQEQLLPAANVLRAELSQVGGKIRDHQCWLAALLAQAVYLIEGWGFPEGGCPIRDVQLIAFFVMIDSFSRQGRLANIGTGEGKSLIVQMLAVARVLEGKNVDCITSNSVLAERDAEEATTIFGFFGITVGNNCDVAANNDIELRKTRYKNNVVYGDTGSFQRDLLLTQFFNKNIRDSVAPALIVDEVDSMFIDSAATTLYISHNIEDLHYLDSIFVTIWMAVATGADTQDYNEYNVRMIESLILQKMADKDDDCLVPAKLVDFAKARLRTWINSAYTAKSMDPSEQYTIMESGMNQGVATVMDLNTGVEQTNTQWSNGLHQFIQLKHLNKLTPVSLKAVFLSNMSFFRYYGENIVGMTGTVGGEVEIELMQGIYYADTFGLPRFNEEIYFELPSVIAITQKHWLDNIKNEVCTIALGLDNDESELDHDIELELTKEILLNAGVPEADITPILLQAANEELEGRRKDLTDADILALVARLTTEIDGVSVVVQTVELGNPLTMELIEAAGVEKEELSEEQQNQGLTFEDLVFQVVHDANPKPKTPKELQYLVDVGLNKVFVDIEKAYDEIDDLNDSLTEVNGKVDKAKTDAEACFALADKLQKASYALLAGSTQFTAPEPEPEPTLNDVSTATAPGSKAREIIVETLAMVESMGIDVSQDDDCKAFIEELKAIETLLNENIILNPDPDDIASITHNQQIEKKCADQARPVAAKLLQRCAKLLTDQGRKHEEEEATQKAEAARLLDEIDDVSKNIQELNDQRAELKGRAVLIICPDQRNVKLIVDKLLRHLPEVYRYQNSADGVSRLTTAGVDERGLTPGDVKARPGTVIVATNIAGRGTNFKTSDLCETNGGLHVLLAYVPGNRRVELQAWGRTARSGNAGTGRFVVRSPDGASAAEKVERRDEKEAERLEVIREETLPKLEAEGELLSQFEVALKNMYSPESSSMFDGDDEAIRNFNSLQNKSFMDHWALWLDSQTERLENVYRDVSARKANLKKDFDVWFATTQEDAKNNTEGYVISSGEQTKLIGLYMQQAAWTEARDLCNKFIEEDGEFSGIPRLYLAMALIGADSRNKRIAAINQIETAVFLLQREGDKLGNHISIIESAQAYLFDQRTGGSVAFFRESRGNEQMLLYRHIDTALEGSGKPVTAEDFLRGYFTEPEDSEQVFQDLIERGYVKDEHVKADLEVFYRVQNPSESMKDRAFQVLADGTVIIDLSDEEKAKLDPEPPRVGLVPNPALGVLEPVILPSTFQYFENYLWELLGKSKDKSFQSITPQLEQLLLALEDVMTALTPMTTSTDCYCFDEDYEENKTGEWEEEALVGRDGLKAALSDVKTVNDGRYFDMEDLLAACVEREDDCFKEDEVSAEDRENAVVAALDALVEKNLINAIKRYLFTEEIQTQVLTYQLQLVDADEEKLDNLDLSPFPNMKDYEDEIVKAIRECGDEPFTLTDLARVTDDKCGEADFDVLRVLLAPPLIDVLSKDPELKKVLDPVRTHEMVMEVIIISLVGLQAAGSKGFLEKDIDSQLASVDELKSVLKVERVLARARVSFYLDDFGDHTGSDQFWGTTPKDEFNKFTGTIGDWMNEDYLDKMLGELALKEVVVSDGPNMGSHTEMQKDTKKIKERIQACINDTTTALEECTGTIRLLDRIVPDLISLGLQFQDPDDRPPQELYEFQRRVTDIMCKFDEKRNWWPSWEQIVVALLGIAQIVAGALLTCLTFGAAIQIGSMLISEGVNDIVVALSSYLMGTELTMASYAKGKAISVMLTLATAGIGTLLKTGSKATRLVSGLSKTVGTWNRVWTVTKAVGKEVVKSLSLAVVNTGIGLASTKFAEMLTQALWNEFESNFTSWVMGSNAYDNHRDEMAAEMEKVFQKFGQDVGDNIIATAMTQAEKNVDSLFKQVEYLAIDACLNLNDQLNTKSQGMKTSKSGYRSVLSSASRVFSASVKTAAVVKPLKDIALITPQYMAEVTKCMEYLRENSDAPPNPVPPSPMDEYIDEKIDGPDGVVTSIMNQIKAKVQTTLIQPTAQRALEKGASDVYNTLNPDSGSTKKVQDENEVTLISFKNIDELTPGEDIELPKKVDPADDIGVPDASGTKTHPSAVIDCPENNPQLVVKDYGKETTLGELQAQDMGDNKGLKLIEGEDNTYNVVREDYQATIEDGFDPEKRTNRSELAAFAETSNMQIVVVDKDGNDTFSHPPDSDDSSDKKVLHVMLLETEDNPEGFYTTVTPGTTTPMDGISDIKDFDKNFASQMVYAEARRFGAKHEDAVAMASDPGDVRMYLNRAKRIARTSPDMKSLFKQPEKKKSDTDGDGKKESTSDGGDIKKDDGNGLSFGPEKPEKPSRVFNYGYPGYMTSSAWLQLLQAALDEMHADDSVEEEEEEGVKNVQTVRYAASAPVSAPASSLNIYDAVTADTDYEAAEDGELSFGTGDAIKIIGLYEDSDWVFGHKVTTGEEGLLHPSLVTKTGSTSAIEVFDTVTADLTYEAAAEGELSFTKGDAIEVTAVYEASAWATGKKAATGEEGFFYDKLVTKTLSAPANAALAYLNVGDTLVALESYTASEENELSYKKDDVLTVVHTYYSDGNNSAWVSACDINHSQHPTEHTSLVHPKNFAKTAAAVTAFKATALTTAGAEAVPKVNDTVTAKQGCWTDGRDELSFSKGDVIKVLEVNDGQEWVYGKSLETGEEGSFFMYYATIDATPDTREPPEEPLRAGDSVLANQDYEAEDGSELSFHNGEEIVITEVNFGIESVTVKSLETGKEGLVLPTHVTKTSNAIGLDTGGEPDDGPTAGGEEKEDETSPPSSVFKVGDTVKAKEPYTATDAVELSFAKDDIIEVVEVYDGYVLVGGKLTKDGKIGLFNPEFVEMDTTAPEPSSETLKPHDIVTANTTYEAADTSELSFSSGDEIEVGYVLERYGMLWGTSKASDNTGYFLSSQVSFKSSGS